jgi:hypothetical protein
MGPISVVDKTPFIGLNPMMEMARILRNASDWEYLTVNVGDTNTWLLSRLFILVAIYKAMQAPGAILSCKP